MQNKKFAVNTTAPAGWQAQTQTCLETEALRGETAKQQSGMKTEAPVYTAQGDLSDTSNMDIEIF